MLCALLILIFFRPFISSLAFPYANYFYSITLAAFLAGWLILKKDSLKNIKEIAWPLFFFILAIIISLLASVNRLNSLSEVYKYVTGIMLLVSAAGLSQESRERTLKILTWSGVAISILAVYQYFFGFRHLLDYLARHNITSDFTLDYIQRKRVFFPFVTPNLLAGYLAMIIPLAFLSRYRALMLLPLFTALILTKSLGGILSLFLATLFYFLMTGPKRTGRIMLYLCGGITVFAIVFIWRTTVATGYSHPFFSTSMRLEYWWQTLGIIKSHFLEGVGLGNFSLPQSRYAHNSYLQIWAEMGILGIASFLWIVFIIFKNSIQLIKVGRIKQNAALLAASAAFLVHNFIDFGFFLPEINLIWWMIMGLSLSFTDRS